MLTAGFLHARLGESFGFLHILTNMFSLYILGTLLEPAVGRLRFGLIYVVSLLAGSFGALLVTPDRLHRGRLGRGLRADGRRASW